MKNRILIAIEIVAALIALAFGIAWVLNPNGQYEPMIALCGIAGTTVVELVRRLTSTTTAKKKASTPITDEPSVLVVRARPQHLYDSRVGDPDTVERIRRPAGIVEHKPEIMTDVIPDNIIIRQSFEDVGRSANVAFLDNATKSDLATTLKTNWHIVHFDCVVGPQGHLFLQDGEITPSTLYGLLRGKDIRILVLMDCDSVKVVSSADRAGVDTLIAATASLPVVVAEIFCRTLYTALAKGYTVGDAFDDARDVACVEFQELCDPDLFWIDGDKTVAFAAT